MRFSCNHCGKRFATRDELAIGRVYRIACRCGNSIVLRFEASLRDTGTSPYEPLRAVPPPLPPPLPDFRARGATTQTCGAAVHRRSSASRTRTEARVPGPSTRVAVGMERAPSRPIALAAPVSLPVALPACEPRRDSRRGEAADPHDDPFARQGPPEPALVSSREFTLAAGDDVTPTGHDLARLDPDASTEDADERSGTHWVPMEGAYRTVRTRAFVAGLAGGAGVALLVVTFVLAAGTSASVVAVSLPSGDETAVATAPTPPPQKAPRAASARRAPSSPTAPDRTKIAAAAAGPRSQSPEPVNPAPEASMTKAAEVHLAATRSNHRGAVKPLDSTPVRTRADPGEPAAEDAEAAAEARRGAAESDDAVGRGDDTQGEDAAKPVSVAHQADRDRTVRIEPVAAGDRPDAETTLADDSTVPEPVPATETIATAKPASD
jgi:hypothetical protein